MVLRHYALLQITVCGGERAAELILQTKTPDRGGPRLTEIFSFLAGEAATKRVGLPGGMTPDEQARLLALRPVVIGWRDALAACGIPDTINHGDLHDGNVFVSADGYRLFDWGDCCISHPFLSLRTILGSAQNTLGVAEDGPECARLREAYLSVWRDAFPGAAVDRAERLARLFAPVNGAMTWDLVVADFSDTERETYGEPVPALLREFLALAEATPPPIP